MNDFDYLIIEEAAKEYIVKDVKDKLIDSMMFAGSSGWSLYSTIYCAPDNFCRLIGLGATLLWGGVAVAKATKLVDIVRAYAESPKKYLETYHEEKLDEVAPKLSTVE